MQAAERIAALSQLAAVVKKLCAAFDKRDGAAKIRLGQKFVELQLPRRAATFLEVDRQRFKLCGLLGGMPSTATEAADWADDIRVDLGRLLVEIETELAARARAVTKSTRPNSEQMKQIRAAVRFNGKNASVHKIQGQVQVRRRMLLAGLKIMHKAGEYNGFKRKPK